MSIDLEEYFDNTPSPELESLIANLPSPEGSLDLEEILYNEQTPPAQKALYSPNTTLLNQKLQLGKITQAEHLHLIKMNNARKAMQQQPAHQPSKHNRDIVKQWKKQTIVDRRKASAKRTKDALKGLAAREKKIIDEAPLILAQREMDRIFKGKGTKKRTSKHKRKRTSKHKRKRTNARTRKRTHKRKHSRTRTRTRTRTT